MVQKLLQQLTVLLLGPALLCGQLRAAAPDRLLQETRQQVLAALASIHSPPASTQAIDGTGQWASVRSSTLWLLAARDNVDRAQLQLLSQQLKSLAAQNAVYANLQRLVDRWHDQLPETNLSTLLASAQKNTAEFVVVDNTAIKALQRTLQADLESLRRSAAIDAQWQSFLHWPETQAAATASIPTSADATRLAVRWANAYSAWIQPEVKSVYQTLTKLAEATACMESAETQTTRRARLERLSTLLTAMQAKTEDSSTSDLEAVYSEMVRFGQAPDLRAALTRLYSHPNLIVRLATEPLARRAAQPILRSFPIETNYDGARVTGTGEFAGQLGVDFLNSANHIAANVQLAGQNTAHTQGGRSGVSVRSTGRTSIGASRALTFAGFGPPRWDHPQAIAMTDITFDNISTNLRRWKRKAAANQVLSGKPAAEQRASQEARDWIQGELKSNTDQLNQHDLLAKVNSFRDQIITSDQNQALVRCGTFPGFIDWRLRYAPPQQFAAKQAFPDVPLRSAVQIAIHPSFFQNMTEPRMAGRRVLAGETIDWISATQTADASSQTSSASPTPDSSASGHVQFADTTPLRLNIHEGKLIASLNLQNIETDGDTFADYTVTVTYRPTIAEGHLRFLADPEINVLPIGFDPKQERLGSRRLSLCRLLERRLQRYVTGDLVFPSLSLTSASASDQADLEVTGYSLNQGWIEISFDTATNRTHLLSQGN